MEMLIKIVEQAHESRGRTVELPFNPERQQFGYIIAVCFEPESTEPTWSLTTGDGNRVTGDFQNAADRRHTHSNRYRESMPGTDVEKRSATGREIQVLSRIFKAEYRARRETGSPAFPISIYGYSARHAGVIVITCTRTGQPEQVPRRPGRRFAKPANT